MTTTTYAGEREQLAIAQQVLDEHITSSVDGRCLKCGAPGPCYRRETAVVVFSRFMRLPRRIPGLTRPELVNARRVSVSPWGLSGKGGGADAASKNPARTSDPGVTG